MKVNSKIMNLSEDALIARSKKDSKKKTKDKNTIDFSSLKEKLDPISRKREEARKKAMKIVSDAFASDQRLADRLDQRRDRIRYLYMEMDEANDNIKEVEKKRGELRNSLGIDENSQEEKDLKLLEKQRKSWNPEASISLTEDEIKRIEQIEKNGLTEYQEMSLALYAGEAPYRMTINDAIKDIKDENLILTRSLREMYKSHTMHDAKEQADAVLEAASKDIISMILEEAKENIEEKFEKEKEKAKEKAEKEEKLKERIDEAKEKKKEKEKFIDEILGIVMEAVDSKNELNDTKEEIKAIVAKMKLIEDDIKGASVDENV
ncbi:hypothetical protein SAMN05216249_11235 [Acetitomaculum ruminis DSM 5522]|uniref:Uncharacterized protein n=1 Tax=Acetitomaculum ruminis DSM 5522 TaxID=1120918 RepID=A0A1I0Z0W2_9FIRM|nr:hypothetical protein [Acetitomaculum ruminis]SFB18756.1 hypothetical protein SAMN05216249_11235 [Acetitomaculum ruminis DSM 5522]